MGQNIVESSVRASGITEGELENILNIHHGKRNHEHEYNNNNTSAPDSQSLVVVENFTEDTLKKVEKELQKVARKLLEGIQILTVVIEACEAFHDLRWCPRLSQVVLPLMKSKLNILIEAMNKTHKTFGNFEFDLCFPAYIEYIKTVVPKYHENVKKFDIESAWIQFGRYNDKNEEYHKFSFDYLKFV